jgi:hypothetical protein
MKSKIALLALLFCLDLVACDEDEKEGCCIGCCDPSNLRVGLKEYYCYNNWTKADCEKFRQLKTNGVDWTFYPSQTCQNRGLVAGN